MMVFWKFGLAFLAVPKTGTHAYQAALADQAAIVFRHPPGLKHMGIRMFNNRFRKLIPDGPAPIETLAVIREPLDWLGSWYRYRLLPQFSGQPESTRDVSFTKFIEGYLAEEQPGYAKIGRQSQMVTAPDLGYKVDYLFKYESQEALQNFLSDRLRIDLDVLEKINVSPRAHLELPTELRSHLREMRQSDFDLYEEAM